MVNIFVSEILKKWALSTGILLCFLGGPCFAGDCFIGKDCFGVVQPYLMERVCYLWSHETRTYKAGAESEFVTVLPSIDLGTDLLHVEFLRLQTEKKFIPFRRGTRIFNCQYDLNEIKRDRDDARQKGIVLPEFNCRGATFEMVPVRIVNSNTCYWVAEADVRCEEQAPVPVTPFTLFEEKLGE